MNTSSTVRRLPMTVLGIFFLAVMIFPVYWMLNSSLQADSGAASTEFLPLNATFSGYAQALEEQGPNFVTSLIVALGTVVLTLVIATPAAYGLARFRTRGSSVFLLVLLITQMIPVMVIANALYPLFNSLFLINNVLGLILANTAAGIPFAVLLIRAFMGAIPGALVEAAMVDGAGNLRAFLSIVVPISKNAIVTAALFTFLSAWSDFLFALTLTSTPEVRPITLGIYDYISANTQDWSAVMATAVLASVPAALLLIFAQRYIAAGAVSGAVK
ncbi:carbohydrate ABC transporter permease [Nonomuraea turcica]|uniref:carbohydrate ABC transporter permease n=1 Tax=Nonomuraea sp. G32 TaxID=3067274 RepID=UPI00273BBA32|nr:carbohydrate ABC transporter permease [Nonomuraea sp. G32]MDP4501677.1 carbohydrate ABC transporter permease [Nonomuraea sp. G32]